MYMYIQMYKRERNVFNEDRMEQSVDSDYFLLAISKLNFGLLAFLITLMKDLGKEETLTSAHSLVSG